jgi:hypothetical protein
MTLPQFLGLLNVFVGLFIVASVLLFGSGLWVWAVRLGTIHRDVGVKLMEWGVVVLFVLIVLLGVARLIERHTVVVAYAAGIIVLIVIALFVLSALQKSAEKKKEEKK